MAIFFSMATAAGAFSSLLARGISEMDGVVSEFKIPVCGRPDAGHPDLCSAELTENRAAKADGLGSLFLRVLSHFWWLSWAF